MFLMRMLREPTMAEELRKDVRAVRSAVRSRPKAATPDQNTERDMVAAAIVEHIRLCNWKIE